MTSSSIQADPLFDVIAASFFRKKRCVLPGIGRLELKLQPAGYDFPQQQISAPRPLISFTPARDTEHIFNEFSAISQLLLEKLLRSGEVAVTGLGVFTYGNGIVDFQAAVLPEALLQPVQAGKVIHKDAAHSMLVGDRETTTTEMQELLNEAEPAAGRWWKAAAFLAAAALGLLLYYLLAQGVQGLASRSPF